MTLAHDAGCSGRRDIGMQGVQRGRDVGMQGVQGGVTLVRDVACRVFGGAA